MRGSTSTKNWEYQSESETNPPRRREIEKVLNGLGWRQLKNQGHILFGILPMVRELQWSLDTKERMSPMGRSKRS